MIMAIDPGLNVGLAYRFSNGHFGTMTMPKQDDWNINMHDLVQEIRQRCADEIVIESFVGFQMQNAYGIETMELIGAVRGACLVLGIPCIKQTPSQRVTRVPTAKRLLEERKAEMRAIGTKWTYTDHEVSALAHLLTREAAIANAAKLASFTGT